jgi:hypothetical protein
MTVQEGGREKFSLPGGKMVPSRVVLLEESA